jgi:DNA-binding NtrC family response regulator
MPKVLLVDDEPRILRSLTAALELDHDIYTSESAHDAQAAIEAGARFDAIISDQIMPEMKGHELLNWCRLKSPEIKRIMLTGVPITDELKQQIDDLENVRIFRKPWNIEEINALLNSMHNESFSTSKDSRGGTALAGYKVLVFEPLEHYQTLCSDLAPKYFKRVIHCNTSQKLLQGAIEHNDAAQIIISLRDGSEEELEFVARVHEACPKAKILITAEPRTIRALASLGSQATYLTILSKPFSIMRLANKVIAKH